MRSIVICAVPVAALFSLACSAGTNDQEHDQPAPSTEASGSNVEPGMANVVPEEVNVEVLNEFEAGTDHVSFLRLGGAEEKSGFMVQFSRSAAYPKGTLDLLLEREQELTLLETFEALAPADLEPHSALVEAHMIQGEARGDTSLRRIEFNVDQRIEKSIASCNANLQFNLDQLNSDADASTTTVRNNVFGAVSFVCPSTNFVETCATQVNGAVIVSSCIEAAELQSVRPWWKIEDQSWKTFSVPASQLGPNRTIGWHFPSSLPPLPGELFPPHKTMAIETFNGNGYHLRAARSQN